MSTATKESNKDEQQRLFEETVHKWWKELEDARGMRAELRRCASIQEVMFKQGYHQLRRELFGTKWCYYDGLAAVAGILAHVKENSGLKLVDAMALPKEAGGEKPRVSGLRFRRLLKCETHEDLFLHLIRVVRLLDNTANVADLATDVYKWGDYTRKDWAFKYYEKAPEAD